MSDIANSEIHVGDIVSADGEGAAQIIRTFSARLNTLLDNAGFASVKAGRYSNLGVKYGVARQQAHRWCNAQALPGPHILVRIAVDFGTTLDWLFGVESLTSAGSEIPLYALKSGTVEAVQSNFQLLGRMRFLASSPTNGHSYAMIQNWSESLEPPIAKCDELLVNLGTQSIDDGGIYIIRTATSTSVRIATIQPDGISVKFSRTTSSNTHPVTYSIDEIFHNESQRFDADWRQPGALVLGRVESITHSLSTQTPSFFSS